MRYLRECLETARYICPHTVHPIQLWSLSFDFGVSKLCYNNTWNGIGLFSSVISSSILISIILRLYGVVTHCRKYSGKQKLDRFKARKIYHTKILFDFSY